MTRCPGEIEVTPNVATSGHGQGEVFLSVNAARLPTFQIERYYLGLNLHKLASILRADAVS